MCSKCSAENGIVDLLPTLGPVRVCRQCYWQQVERTKITFKLYFIAESLGNRNRDGAYSKQGS